MWLITLIILAIAAFFIVKYMKSQSERQQLEHNRSEQGIGADGALDGHIPNQGGSSGSASAAHSTASPAQNNDAESRGTAHGSGGAGAAIAGAAAAGAAIAGGAAAMSNSAANAAQAAAGGAGSVGRASLALDTGNTLGDVREMIKILNLAEPDSKRLAITAEQFRALRNADTGGLPDKQAIEAVANRLRKMLA